MWGFAHNVYYVKLPRTFAHPRRPPPDNAIRTIASVLDFWSAPFLTLCPNCYIQYIIFWRRCQPFGRGKNPLKSRGYKKN